MFRNKVISACLILPPILGLSKDSIENAYPKPSLKPDEVFRIQLLAMKYNDASDLGIKITFHFASPSNKRVTGPLRRFIQLVKNPSYSPLLNHLDADFLALKFNEKNVVQDVIITFSKGKRIGYRFCHSNQQSPDYRNCRMTDAVMLFKVPEASA